MTKKGKNDTWVYLDLRDERFFGFSLNILSKACELAQLAGGEAVAVMVGGPGRVTGGEGNAFNAGSIPVDQAAGEAVQHGAGTVLVLENEDLTVPRADLFAATLAEVVKERSPGIVLFALSDFGRELAARTARLLGKGLIADCADIIWEEGNIVADCPSWGGEIMARITFAPHEDIGFATVQPTISKAVRKQGEPGNIETIPCESVVVPKGMRLIDRRRHESGQQNLEEADVVVVGGAGVGSADGFRKIRELASILGGEVGATRPAVLQHWVEEKRMIGQTGKTVHPKLLLSVGTSGAVQYTAGIMESGTVVAINRDKSAPIYSIADLGIVGDWNTIVPILTDRLRQLVMRQLVDDLCDCENTSGAASFGARICKLREAQGWTREALAQATDQSPEYVSQVENDEAAPPVSFLLRLARVLGVDPGTFLRDEEKAVIRDQRTQGFVKRTKNYSYQTLTPDAEAAHLRAFLITIESWQAHEPVAYKHEGEEFIFVLEGELELTLGGKPHHLKQLESIRFNSDVPHKLKSRSDNITKCIVVLYSP